jgi:AraC-like DNA-binding protein
MEKPFESAELVARIHRHLARNAELSRRHGRRILGGPEEVEATSADAAFLERLTFVLEERHHEPSLSVEDVAFELGVSPRQFRRRLGALTSRSPSAHLRGFRLARAAQLLGAGAGTVSETAYRVGFASARVFARQFRAHFGCAPSAYEPSASDAANEGPERDPGGDGTAVA